MSNSARSILVFAAYLALSGLSFMLIPEMVLPMFGLAAPTEVWIRLVGLLAFILALYFYNAARAGDRRFIQDTLLARVIFFTGVTLFVLVRWASPVLILFGLIDLAGATWTWSALRKEGESA